MGMLFGLLALTVIGIGVAGWLWITIMAFNEGENVWGIGCLLFAPICIVYGLLNFQELKVPLMMVTAGFVGRLSLGVLAIMMS